MDIVLYKGEVYAKSEKSDIHSFFNEHNINASDEKAFANFS